jgi:hypothetical protein
MLMSILLGILATFLMFAASNEPILVKVFGDNVFTRWLVRRNEKRLREIENQTVAQRAMKRARTEQAVFSLTDIGLLAYRDRNTSKVIRNTPVITDTRYLRPFAEISARQRMHAQVTLALLDSSGQPVFIDKNMYLLNPKPTHLVTKTWLPLENLVHSGGSWSLVVEVNDLPLAIHRFGWVGLANNDIVEQLSNDGELSTELRQAVKSGHFRRMSLDELLSDQEE